MSLLSTFSIRPTQPDVRVYELLDQKFQLFSGVFGASDEVLGAIGNGVDFEKRIAQIYQLCRTPKEIKEAFDALQEELQEQISDKMLKARTTLLENFDESVKQKLRSDPCRNPRQSRPIRADSMATHSKLFR